MTLTFTLLHLLMMRHSLTWQANHWISTQFSTNSREFEFMDTKDSDGSVVTNEHFCEVESDYVNIQARSQDFSWGGGGAYVKNRDQIINF